jgi:hypothetical protein
VNFTCWAETVLRFDQKLTIEFGAHLLRDRDEAGFPLFQQLGRPSAIVGDVMLQKIVQLGFAFGIAGALSLGSEQSQQQGSTGISPDNQCVNCHSKSSQSKSLTGRYLEWHFSAHRTKGVGCDSCHGGDASARDARTAHRGVFGPAERESRVNFEKLPETCGVCHKAVVNSFIESAHYKVLSSSRLGPSCNTCHAHMASSVAMFPGDAATYCTHCHNTINGLLPQKPDIPANARKVMESIGRAKYAIIWAQSLLKEAQDRKLNVAEELADMRLVQQLFFEAKVGWHSFSLEGAGIKAEKAFEESLRLREVLMKKLGHS